MSRGDQPNLMTNESIKFFDKSDKRCNNLFLLPQQGGGMGGEGDKGGHFKCIAGCMRIVAFLVYF